MTNSINFAEPFWLFLLLLALLPFLFRGKSRLGFSTTKLGANPSIAARIVSLAPSVLLAATIVLLSLALARPQIPGEPGKRVVLGRDIMLVVDISFSMSFPFEGNLEEHTPPAGLDFAVPHDELNERRKDDRRLKLIAKDDGNLKRIDAAQNALLRFVENRWQRKTGDRIGLIVFDDRPRYGFPLTTDLRMLYRKSQFIVNGLGLGTNFGNKPPGPIDLALDHLDELGEAQSSAIIMLTDGEDFIDWYTSDRLISRLKEAGTRLYLVGIGETLAKEEVDIITLTQRSGGHVFRVENTEDMENCFASIDQLEQSLVSTSEVETRIEIFHYFAWGALALLLLSLSIEAVIITR